MKKNLFLLLVFMVFLFSAHAETLPEAYIEEGYTRDGSALCLPEGWVRMGLTPKVENNEIVDWEDVDESHILENFFWYEPEETYAEIHSIVFPSSLKIMGMESVYGFTVDEIILNEGLEEMYNPFYGTTADRLIIPSTLKTIWDGSMSSASFKEFVVSEDNPWFCSVDGVLFSKDKKRLIAYPQGRADLHYDVPAGTEIIGRSAFLNCESLQTVSFPLSLKAIEQSAFYACGHLNSLSIPLTVTHIGSYAFSDCVSLQRVSLPPALSHLLSQTVYPDHEPEENEVYCVFQNCSALGSAYAGDNGFTESSTIPDHEYRLRYGQYVTVLASPSKASVGIPVYASKDTSSPVLRRIPSGSVFSVLDGEMTWADLHQEEDLFVHLDYSDLQGYILRSDLVYQENLPRLFEYADCVIPSGKIDIYDLEQTDSVRRRVSVRSSEVNVSSVNYYVNIPWISVFGTFGNEYLWAYTFVGNGQFTRVPTGDGKTYGIVLASEIGNRVNLREKADKDSKSIAKYFSGTQLEILGSKGNFYSVWINGQTGYIMKDYVRIVPEAK